MITLHHLDFSRSTRVLWLLEELGLDFELIRYSRTEQGRAPSALADIHPLGKSPILVDGDLVLAESSAILRYLDRQYGDERFSPPAGTNERAVHDEWLDYIEGSAALPITLSILGPRMGGLPPGLEAFAAQQLTKTLDYIAKGIGEGPFLMGKQLMLADMQISYLLSTVDGLGVLNDYPAILAYLKLLKEQPGMLKAVSAGGPMSPKG